MPVSLCVYMPNKVWPVRGHHRAVALHARASCQRAARAYVRCVLGEQVGLWTSTALGRKGQGRAPKNWLKTRSSRILALWCTGQLCCLVCPKAANISVS